MFLAVLDRHGCCWTLSSGAGWQPLCTGVQASHWGGLSYCGAPSQKLWGRGSVAPWHVGSFWTRDWIRISIIGRQILNHCTTREAPIRQDVKMRVSNGYRKTYSGGKSYVLEMKKPSEFQKARWFSCWNSYFIQPQPGGTKWWQTSTIT